jgi:sugar phosphate permease
MVENEKVDKDSKIFLKLKLILSSIVDTQLGFNTGMKVLCIFNFDGHVKSLKISFKIY